MFTTLHSIAVVPAALSYCHMILRNSVNRLHCAEVSLHSLTVLWVVLSCYYVDTVQFRKQGFITLMFTYIAQHRVFESALPYYHMILCNSVNGRSIAKSCIVQLGQSETPKMLSERIMFVAFCSDSRLAFPRSDYASLSRIALMFTTLHSFIVLRVELPCCCVVLCNSGNRASLQ